MLIKNPLSPDRERTDSVQTFLIENNGVDKDKVADGLSIEMAEEWIADPLGGNSTGNAKAPLNIKKSSMLEQYGPNSKANQHLLVYSEIAAAEKPENGGEGDEKGQNHALTSHTGIGVGKKVAPIDDDDATVGGISAITAGSYSIADNASTSYADSIAAAGASSRRSKSYGSSKGSSKSTMSINQEAQAARSKARAQFYAELEETHKQMHGNDDDNGISSLNASVGDDSSAKASVDLNKLDIGDALSIATVSSTPINKVDVNTSASVDGSNVGAPASLVASPVASSPSAAVVRGKAVLSSGFSASTMSGKVSSASKASPKKKNKVAIIKPTTPEHDLRVMDTLDLGVNQGPSAGGGAMFEEGAGNLELPFEISLSSSTLQRHNHLLATSSEVDNALEHPNRKPTISNVAKSGAGTRDSNAKK